MAQGSFDFSHLTAAERLHLAQELLDSLHDDAPADPLTAEQRAMIDRRHVELESGAVPGIPLDKLRQSLLDRR